MTDGAAATARHAGDPNSQHQMWGRWVFLVRADRKIPSEREARVNFIRWCAAGFKTTVGRARCDRRAGRAGIYYRFAIEVEGPPVHDPEYRAAVRRQFEDRFLFPGFGPGATLVRFEAGVLAGDTQDGRPPEQMIVMPTVNLLDPAPASS